MTTRIGLALARDAVRAVAVRRRRILWAAEAPLEPGAALDAAIRSLLAAAPVPRFPRPVLSAAIGPQASQVRLVAGLPDIQDSETLAAFIREGAASFFLKNGERLITSVARSAGVGVALAAAIDEPCVEVVRDVCRARGWRFGFIAPVPVALAHALTEQFFTWTDGAVVLEVTRSEGSIESVRTRPTCAAESTFTPPQPVPELASLGADALRYADAYGAAASEAVPALALDAAAAGFWTESEARRRLVLPGLVLVVGVAAVLLSPLAAAWSASRAEARVARVRADQWQAVVSALAQLDRVTAILQDFHGFAESRSSVTRVLGELTRALPQGSVLVSLELGDTQGQIVALSSNPAAVLAAVERLPGARSVELVGPVRRETVAASEVQRVAVSWRRGGS